MRELRVKRLQLQEDEGVVCGKQPDDFRQLAFLWVSVLHVAASFAPAAAGDCCIIIGRNCTQGLHKPYLQDGRWGREQEFFA